MAFGFLVPAATNWYLAAPVIFLLVLFNLSITIGVLHMHTNRHLFVSHRANRVVDVLCCLPGALTAADMREVHVLNHHRFNDGSCTFWANGIGGPPGRWRACTHASASASTGCLPPPPEVVHGMS